MSKMITCKTTNTLTTGATGDIIHLALPIALQLEQNGHIAIIEGIKAPEYEPITKTISREEFSKKELTKVILLAGGKLPTCEILESGRDYGFDIIKADFTAATLKNSDCILVDEKLFAANKTKFSKSKAVIVTYNDASTSEIWKTVDESLVNAAK